MSKVIINYDECEGADCGECVDVCPMEIFVIDDDKKIAIQHPKECSYCEVCMDVCPHSCIKIEDED